MTTPPLNYYRTPTGSVVRYQGETPGYTPVVVIDPEDSKAVERLLEDYWDRVESDYAVSRPEKVSALQAVLRRIADPKPAEPTRRFAEVKDTDGQSWFLLYPSTCGQFWAPDGEFTNADAWRHYAYIDAVEVVSEGVQ